MIIYRATKRDFVNDCREGRISFAVKTDYENVLGKAHESEVRAWDNSLRYMASVVMTPEIAEDTTVCIEYKLPNSGHRIDFIIAGLDDDGHNNIVIVELKQWQNVVVVEDKKYVNTFVGGANRDVAHPSYQAWSYAVTLENYNETIRDEGINLFPCAYLHNYNLFPGDKINDPAIFPELNEAPAFFHSGEKELQSFILKHVTKASPVDIMDKIDNGRLKPSKSLQDVLGSLLKGKKEFLLLDDQKVFFENIMAYVRRTALYSDEKNVFIIQGGPGTGKSVLAINLLASTIREGKMAAYVTKNSAPRYVYEELLVKKDRFRKSRVDELFLGSGSFVTARENAYDALFVDEAHRLNEKSGLFHNKGENQIKEIINSSRLSVFFIDEDQVVTSQDIGSVEAIKYWAEKQNAKVIEGKLTSQFRCNGSDGYLSFIDDILEINHTQYSFDPDDYDIEIMDDPNLVMEKVKNLNLKDNKARVLAGYCWEWKSKRDGMGNDIIIDDKLFYHQWNFSKTKTWAIDEESVDQIGCIHTSQGLEFSYCGVIIGDDLRYENGRVITDYTKRASTDKSLNGLKGLCSKGNELALKKADTVIRNTYKTLLSRAMKGCFVYCTDKALSDYLKSEIERNKKLMAIFKKDNRFG